MTRQVGLRNLLRRNTINTCGLRIRRYNGLSELGSPSRYRTRRQEQETGKRNPLGRGGKELVVIAPPLEEEVKRVGNYETNDRPDLTEKRSDSRHKNSNDTKIRERLH